MSRSYTDAEKAAYWKEKALSNSAVLQRAPTVRSARKTPAVRTSTSRRYPPTVSEAAKPRRTSTKVAAKSTLKAAPASRNLMAASSKEKSPSIGGRIGSTLGGMIGHGIQNLITTLTGFGDYDVSENSIFRGGIPNVEIVNTSKHGGVIVRHREFLGNIPNTAVFTNTVYPLNPGLGGTFPWLAGIANGFEQFRFRGAVAEFKSTSSDSVLSTNSSGSLGSVMMATQYDSVEPPFTDQATMLNHEFSNSRKPSEDFCHPVECKSSLTANELYYIRNGPVVAGSDERLYDLGLLQVATEGMQGTPGTSSCGQLWITYEVELYKPRVSPGAPVGGILSDHFQISGFTNSFPLGGTSVRSTTSSLKGTIVAANRYLFPTSVFDGNYLVTMSWKGTTGVTASYPVITLLGGATLLNLWEGNSTNSTVSPPGGMVSSVNMQQSFIININGSGAGFQYTGAITLPGGANFPCDLFITQVDVDLINKKRKPKKPKKRYQMLPMPGAAYPDMPEFDEEEETPRPVDDEESSEEYVRVKKADIKRKSLTTIKDC